MEQRSATGANQVSMMDDPISVRYTRGNELCFIVMGALLGPPMAALPLFRTLGATDVGDMGGLIALVPWGLGPQLLQLLAVTFGLWLICLAIASAWRLFSHAPALTVYDEGIRFHPSLHPGVVPWSDIRRIEVANRPDGLCFRLRRRFWSLTWPGSSRTVELKLVAVRLSVSEGRRLVVALRRLAKGNKK